MSHNKMKMELQEQEKIEQDSDKLKFIKLLAEEIVNKMVEMGHNPTPRVRDYIG